MTAVDPRWLDELRELLAIPSVSADPQHSRDVVRAAEWVRDFIRRIGGTADVLPTSTHPLTIGELRASSGAESAPTVLVYGHFDVQPPAPLELWESPPFEATVRDEWLYARGVADDKGHVWMLLKAAEQLAGEGRLPVNLRFTFDGEEESGGHQIVDFLVADERPADAAIVFDGLMLARGRPAFIVATRGIISLKIRVRTGEKDLHSGLFGGAALNATHVLVRALEAVVARDGRLPEPLRAGVEPPSGEELAAWELLQPGQEALAEQGARPMDERAADEFYVRTWAEPSLDVNGLVGGEPYLRKTVLPVEAQALVSIRLVPGQDPAVVAAAAERLVREAAHEGAEVEVDIPATSPPALVQVDSPVVQLGLSAFERVVGARPALVRIGGSLPVMSALEQRGIPAILTGFDLPDGNIHSPNERLLLEHVPLGVAAARELYLSLGELR